MYLGGIWIKAFAQIVLSLITFLCGLTAYKKLNWKQFELYFAILCSVVLLVFGCININHAIKPNIQRVNVNYSYQSSNGIIFGRELHFIDKEGNVYDLTMDPVTNQKIFKGKEFEKNIVYTVTYEKNSNAIVEIKEN